jgi:uncharacterized protein
VTQFLVKPPIASNVTVGPVDDGVPANRLFIGKLAENGPYRGVDFGFSREFVSLILGKRGSGKSFTLGTILESLATTADSSSLSQLHSRPGVLLLDPMMNFWPSEIPLRPDGPEKVRRQYSLLSGWNCKPEDSSISIWLPRGFRLDTDYPGIRDFSIKCADLDSQDWADMVGQELLSSPQGILLGDALERVRETGYRDPGGREIKPQVAFDVEDLANAAQSLTGGDHRADTIRALNRTLRGLDRSKAFTRDGTLLTQLSKPGHLAILMLPPRIGHQLRRVIARVVIRRLLKERERASQIRQRLDVESLQPGTVTTLEAELALLVPKTILALDEAQELLGDEADGAREALEDFCLLGRNYGLSLILATQRPMASAISAKVRAQVDTYFLHRLLTSDDIGLARSNLISSWPDEVRIGERDCSFEDAIRSLKTGRCIVSSDRIEARGSKSRCFFMDVRPRTRVHGGEVS